MHLGERTASGVTTASLSSNPGDEVSFSVDHRFQSTSFLRFLIFVYNAAPAADAKPDVALQVQLLRDGQPVMTTPQKKIVTDVTQDLNRIPYAAEISLAGLRAGRYRLRISVVDRISKRSATEETHIEID